MPFIYAFRCDKEKLELFELNTKVRPIKLADTHTHSETHSLICARACTHTHAHCLNRTPTHHSTSVINAHFIY